MAVDKNLGFNGCVESATFIVDSATLTAIGTDYDGAKGKAVALTANETIGYGSSGDGVFGVIEKVHKNGTAAVRMLGGVDGVAITDTAENQPVFGDYLAVDGAGKLIKATPASSVVTHALAATCTVESSTDGDNITVTGTTVLGATANDLKILLTTAADDTLAVTKTDGTKTINIALAKTTASKNTAALIQAAIRALSTVGSIDVTGLTCTAVASWDTTAIATGETEAVSFTGGVTATAAVYPAFYGAVAISVDTTAKIAKIKLV